MIAINCKVIHKEGELKLSPHSHDRQKPHSFSVIFQVEHNLYETFNSWMWLSAF